MGQVNVNITARREMAGEKAGIIGKKIKRPSMLELAAEVWNKKKEEKEEKDDRLKIDNEEGLFKSPGFLQSPAEGVDWKPVSGKTLGKEEKKGGTNSSGIWRHARAIMLREWSMALGRRRIDPRVERLEREAFLWKGRQGKAKQDG